MLQIRCKNNNKTKSFPEGTSLLDVYHEFADELQMPYPVVSAKVNNASQGLKFRLFQNRDVEFLDARQGSGHRVYVRSLCFVLYKAASDVFPGSKLFIEHTISRGYYCNFKKKGGEPLAEGDVERIHKRMEEIIALDMPFRRSEATNEEAIRVFAERGFTDKVKLLETSGQIYSDYYMLGDTVDYYYGPLVPSAGYLKVWDVEPYHDGMLLRVPDWHNPLVLAEKVDMPKTYEMFAEKTRWDIIMRLSNAGDVNKAIMKGHASELIQVSEALQEKKIVQIAEEIDRRFRAEENPVRLVLITGPSSSGKTTFCKRLSIQLLACGLRPYSISTDDYFVNRVDTPKLPNGDYDFDNIEAVEYSLLEDHLTRLMKGERVEVPEYNFVTGKREYNGKKVKLSSDSVLIIEGIHALNPLLTQKIDDSKKFKIYISALTSISLDDHNWIPVRDNRRFAASSATTTRALSPHSRPSASGRMCVRPKTNGSSPSRKRPMPCSIRLSTSSSPCCAPMPRLFSRVCQRTVRNTARPTVCSSSFIISSLSATRRFPPPASCVSSWEARVSNTGKKEGCHSAAFYLNQLLITYY